MTLTSGDDQTQNHHAGFRIAVGARFLYDFARIRIRDDELAKDIVQECFINLWRQLGSTQFRADQLASYLYKTVQNLAINYMLRDQRKATYLASLRDFVNAGAYVTDEKVRENEVMRQIETEIARMPKKMRAIFEMSRKGYLSRRQIAEATNVSEETVKKQIANALKILKSKLGAHMYFCIMVAILLISRYM